MREIYDFTGDYSDRSELDLSFDGINLIVTVEDQNDRHRRMRVQFDTTVKFEWDFEGTLLDYPNEPRETLIEHDAGDYLYERSDNDHPFLTPDLKLYSVMFCDLGRLQVVARSVAVTSI